MATKNYSGMWVVRAVSRGDMITVVDPAKKDSPNPEKRVLGISQIKCPKVYRKTPVEVIPDDEYGFEAREFVRKAIIGKTIKFVQEEIVAQLEDRPMGAVLYQKEGKTRNIGVDLVENGFAKFDNRGRTNNDYTKQLAAAEIEAITNKAGQHSSEDPSAHVRRNLEIDSAARDEVAKMKGTKIQGIVENVFAGHQLNVLLLPVQKFVGVQLTGIVCDKKDPVPISVSDPYAPSTEEEQKLWVKMCHEAKNHVEKLLLHRELTFIIEGSKFDNLLCTIVNGDSVFQDEVLKRGYAKVFDQTSSLATYRERLRKTEERAKAQKVGRWAHYVPPAPSSGGDNASGSQLPADFSGPVVQVVSADTLVVLNEATGKEVRLMLGSIRGGGSSDDTPPPPKQKNDGAPSPTNRTNTSNFAKMDRMEGCVVYRNWFLEGRELLRKELIGKTVDVKFDYVALVPLGKPGDPDTKIDPRPCATVYYDNGKNPALEAVKAGFAVPVFSKEGSSRDAFKYNDAFADAKAAGRGLHGAKGKNAGEHKIVDITSQKPSDDDGKKKAPSKGSAEKGKSILNNLQRTGGMMGGAGIPKLKATVEHVLGPARVKLWIHRDSMHISLNMAGVGTPSLPMPGSNETADPLAEEALAFTRRRLLQREVEVQVEHFHNPSFIGNVYLDGKSFAITLLEEGLATMLGQNLSSMSCKGDGESAEAAAKKNKLGIHSAGMPRRVMKSVEKFDKQLAGKSTVVIGDQKQVKATITDVVDGTQFYFQTEAQAEIMKKVDSNLASLRLDALAGVEKVPASGSHVAAKFSLNKQWYRAKVMRSPNPGKVEVLYIDFGNKEVLPLASISRTNIDESLKKWPAQCSEGHIAFMHKLGPNEPGFVEGSNVVVDFVEGRQITIAHEYSEGRKRFYTIRAGKRAVQEELISKGWGLMALSIQEEPALSKPVNFLKGLEETVRRKKEGMWGIVHGDPRSYEDDDY